MDEYTLDQIALILERRDLATLAVELQRHGWGIVIRVLGRTERTYWRMPEGWSWDMMQHEQDATVQWHVGFWWGALAGALTMNLLWIGWEVVR